MNRQQNEIFKAFKEKSVSKQIQNKNQAIKQTSKQKNIFDLQLLDKSSQDKFIAWATQKDSKNVQYTLDINQFNNDFLQDIEKLRSQLNSATDDSSYVVKDALGDINIPATKIKLDKENLDMDKRFEIERSLQQINIQRQNIRTQIQTIKDQHEKDFNAAVSKLQRMADQAKSMQNQNGQHVLYFAYWFMQGSSDKIDATAPCILIPIKITKVIKKSKVIFERDPQIIVNTNRLLGVWLNSQFSIMSKSELEDTDITALVSSDFQNIHKVVYNSNAQIEVIKNKQDNSLYNIQDSSIKVNPGFSFSLYRAQAIGIYQIQTQIYDDYTKLENKDTTELIDKLLQGNQDDISNREEIRQINSIPRKAADLKLIQSLDSSQETAVYMAKKCNGLVIYGPPGTGKQQVITNIVADSIASRQRVLMVSEKATALQVVYKRLKQLNEYAILLTDSQDTKQFSNQLSRLIGKLLTDPYYDNDRYTKDCTTIDSSIDRLDEIHDVLNDADNKAKKPLYWLYKNSDRNQDTDLTYSIISNKEEYDQLIQLQYDEVQALLDDIQAQTVQAYKEFGNIDLTAYRLGKIRLPMALKQKKDIEDNKNKLSTQISYQDTEEIDSLNKGLAAINQERQRLNKLSSVLQKCTALQQNQNLMLKIENTSIDLDKIIKTLEQFSLVEQQNSYDIENLNLNNLDQYIQAKLNDDSEYAQLNSEISEDKELINNIDNVFYIDSLNVTSKGLSIDRHERLVDFSSALLYNTKCIMDKYYDIQNRYGCNSDSTYNQSIDEVRQIEAQKYSQLATAIRMTLDTYNGQNIQSQSGLNVNLQEYSEDRVKALVYQKGQLFRSKKQENQYNKQILEALLNEINNQIDYTVNAYINEITALKSELIDKYKQVRIHVDFNVGNDQIYSICLNKVNCLYNSVQHEIDIDNKKIDYIQDQYSKKALSKLDGHTKYIDKLIDDLNRSLGYDLRAVQNYINAETSKLDTREAEDKHRLEEISDIVNKYNELTNKINEQRESFKRTFGIDEDKFDLDIAEKYNDNMDEADRLSRMSKQQLLLVDMLSKNNSKQQIENAYIQVVLNDLYNQQQYKLDDVNDSILKYSSILDKVESAENDKIRQTFKIIDNTCFSMLEDTVKTASQNLSDIKVELGKKRNRKTVRQIMRLFGDDIIKLPQVWLMTPDVVSDVLPLNAEMFDLVVFDEAQQMFIQNAIPQLYRSKKAIVAGDDKQLKPQNFFASNVDTDETLDILDDTVGQDASLLDQAKKTFNSQYLAFHYRARYSELIQFSNAKFYNGQLKLAPNVQRIQQSNPPIKYLNVHGVYDKGTNQDEAEKITELVKNLLQTEPEKTIGIVTFNIKQRDLIQSALDDKAADDQKFAQQLEKAKNRVDNGEDTQLFVKNLEEVQGDERDIIIFSTGIGQDITGKLQTNLGPLRLDGGENRLNVAVSRAKDREYIVTSIEPYELNVEAQKNAGPKLFKQFLDYAKAVSSNNTALVNSIIYTNSAAKEPRFDQPFEMQVYNELINLGWTVETQVGVRGYRIDLAVYDEKLGVYLAGIECDGRTYHSSKSARERDISRQRFLESRGWTILRIWSSCWWSNNRKEIQRIDAELRKRQAEIAVHGTSSLAESNKAETSEKETQITEEKAQTAEEKTQTAEKETQLLDSDTEYDIDSIDDSAISSDDSVDQRLEMNKSRVIDKEAYKQQMMRQMQEALKDPIELSRIMNNNQAKRTLGTDWINIEYIDIQDCQGMKLKQVRTKNVKNKEYKIWHNNNGKSLSWWVLMLCILLEYLQDKSDRAQRNEACKELADRIGSSTWFSSQYEDDWVIVDNTDYAIKIKSSQSDIMRKQKILRDACCIFTDIKVGY